MRCVLLCLTGLESLQHIPQSGMSLGNYPWKHEAVIAAQWNGQKSGTMYMNYLRVLELAGLDL